jgi:hypothetical protein
MSWAFSIIQVPLDVQLLALQLLFELLQSSNIRDASALRTLKCLLTGCSTLSKDKAEM